MWRGPEVGPALRSAVHRAAEGDRRQRRRGRLGGLGGPGLQVVQRSQNQVAAHGMRHEVYLLRQGPPVRCSKKVERSSARLPKAPSVCLRPQTAGMSGVESLKHGNPGVSRHTSTQSGRVLPCGGFPSAQCRFPLTVRTVSYFTSKRCSVTFVFQPAMVRPKGLHGS